jgi:hypothetical protein
VEYYLIIPVIAGLIAAAATTAGGVATAVSKSKEAQKNALEADSARKLDELAALKLEKEKSGKGVLEFLQANPNLATSLLTTFANANAKAKAKEKRSGLRMIKKKLPAVIQ